MRHIFHQHARHKATRSGAIISLNRRISLVLIAAAVSIVSALTVIDRRADGAAGPAAYTATRTWKEPAVNSDSTEVSRSGRRRALLTESTSTDAEGSWDLGDEEDIGKNLQDQANDQSKAIEIRSRMTGDINGWKTLDSTAYTVDSWAEYSSDLDAANDLVHDGSLDVSALQSTLDDLERSHAALKTVPKIAPAVNQGHASVPSGPTVPVNEIQSYAHDKVVSRGWSEADFTALVWLWNRESGWNPNASNASSGAYGIPQCLGHAECQSDAFKTDYRVQVDWGLGYIAGRYGTPSTAQQHSLSTGWY